MEEFAVSIPKTKWASVSLVLLAMVLGWGNVACAQDQSCSRGNLSGVVYDSSKGVVPGAKVTIAGPIGVLTQETNEQGSFLFSTLVPGNYSVRVEKAGFMIASFRN